MGPAASPLRALAGRLLPPTLAVALAVGGLALLPGRVAAWTPGAFNASSEADLVSLTNQARAAAGLPALRVDGTLHDVARWRSQDMADRGYFSHSIPGAGSVFDELDRRGYCYTLAGENIGWNTYPDDQATAAIQDMFMNSAGHRSNILGPDWNVIGVGAYSGDGDRKTWTVLFAARCGAAKPTPTPQPTPKPTPKPPPTAQPTASSGPAVSPTARPTPRPTPRPTAEPTPQPTPSPVVTPSPTPSPQPTPPPTPTPSPAASVEPALSPSLAPSPRPTLAPTASPGSFPPGVSLRVRPLPGQQGLVEALVSFVLSGLFGF